MILANPTSPTSGPKPDIQRPSVNRQSVFREGASSNEFEVQRRGPNPDFRAMNIAKSGRQRVDVQAPSFTLMFGIGIFWDVITFLIGLIPAVGWAINAFILFPFALFNLWLMAKNRGCTNKQFFSAYKYVFIEPIPYLNIVPVFSRGVVLIMGDLKKEGIAGAINTATKLLKK